MTGSNLFAPCRLYGSPDDLRLFIDRAHAFGLGVILDVVYNHFGPDGNYLGVFSDDYLPTATRATNGATASTSTAANSAPVREFFISNGRYWIEEFHFDGFRFDATQSIYDESDEYILGAIGRAARARRRRALDSPRRGERTAGNEADPAAERRRRRSGRALERRLAPQRDRRADRATARPITPITGARRRNSSPRRSTATFSRGNATFGRRPRAVGQQSDASPAAFVYVHRKSRPGLEHGVWRPRAVPHLARALSRVDRVVLAWARGRRCFFKARNLAPRRRSYSSPHVGRCQFAGSDSQRPFRISGAIPVRGRAGSPGAAAAANRSGRPSSGANSIGEIGSDIRSCTRSIGDLIRLRQTDSRSAN